MGNGYLPITSQVSGGIERYVFNLATAQSRDNSVTVIDVCSTGGTMQFHVLGIRPAPFRRANLFAKVAVQINFSLHAKGLLHKLIAEEKPDIIHFHYQFSGGMLLADVQAKGVLCAYTVHNRMWSDIRMCSSLRQRMLYHMDLKAIQSASKLIALNRTSAENLSDFFGVPRSRIAVIPVGVDTSLFSPPRKPRESESPFVIICVARIARYKNQISLIRLVSALAKMGLRSRLFLVGPVDERDYYRILTREVFRLDLSSHVHFLGSVSLDTLVRLYHSAHLFVLPSLLEGQAQATLEAMACGVPVLLSDIGPHRELAQEGAAIISDFDSPLNLADTVANLVKDGERRERLGQRGREYVSQHHTWRDVCQQVLELYGTRSPAN